MDNMKYVIGLTGTIASGKSTVCRYLQDYWDFMVIDADLVARQVVEDLAPELAKVFGKGILFLPDSDESEPNTDKLLSETPDLRPATGVETSDSMIRAEMEATVRVNRKALGEIVFHDADKLQQLNGMVHPETCRRIAEVIASSEAKRIAVEAIELLRSGLKDLVQEVWVVYAPPEIRVRRMMEERGLSEEAAKSRIQSQWDDATYQQHADVVIASTGEPLDHLYRQVDVALLRRKSTTDKE